MHKSISKLTAASAIAGAFLLTAPVSSEAAVLVAPAQPITAPGSFSLYMEGTETVIPTVVDILGSGFGYNVNYTVGECFFCAIEISGSSIVSRLFTGDSGTLSVANLGRSSIVFVLVGPTSDNKAVLFNVDLVVTPLPAAAVLFGTALVGLGWVRRRRNRATAAA